ncbi:hypothetical protein NQ314_009608 [Rhamnusium bicolor]|uniref:Uncharacterized protein n=1 Tax=Rhamnusium bicolor TaxID=1586634 RepID=A0AAV8XYZ7_9CUCU|nr:hypothetical protein NQ314_009608 [Rhamnusium bicolor]
MERLFVALDPNGFSMQLKRVALSTLGSAASAVKEGMLPYFEKIIEVLNLYINSDPNSEVHQLQCYAIESLAVVAQFIGTEHFKPLAGESLQLGLRILEKTDDPDIRKSVYALFAALAIVMKEEISPALPKIINEMIESIQSSEGIVTHYEDEEKDEIDVYAELSDEDDDFEEDIEASSSGSADSTQCRYSVENSYNEEKEQACLALREICLHTGYTDLGGNLSKRQLIDKLKMYFGDDIQIIKSTKANRSDIILSSKSSSKDEILHSYIEISKEDDIPIFTGVSEYSVLHNIINNIKLDMNNIPEFDTFKNLDLTNFRKYIPEGLIWLVSLLISSENYQATDTQILSLCQDIIFAHSQNKKFTPKHVALAQEEINKYKKNDFTVIPQQIVPERFMQFAADNIDILEETLDKAPIFMPHKWWCSNQVHRITILLRQIYMNTSTHPLPVVKNKQLPVQLERDPASMRNHNTAWVLARSALYCKAKEIQWLKSDQCHNIIVRLGGFNIMLNFLKVIGQYMEPSGLKDVWIESDLYGESTVQGIFTGKKWNNGIRAHKLTYESLWRIILPMFEKWLLDAKSDQIHSINLAKLLATQLCTSITEKREFKNEFQSIVASLGECTDAFEEFTFYLNFYTAKRSGNWDLHLKSLRCMIPWFFAYDHYNYSRCASVYLADMLNLESTAPNVYVEFLKGNFVIKRLPGAFNTISVDQALEHVNKSSKNGGGIVGLTKNSTRLDEWGVSDLISQNIEIGSKRKVIDEKSVVVLQHQFNKYKVFTHNQDYLLCISTNTIFNKATQDAILNAHKLGEEAFIKFVGTMDSNEFYKPIKKNKIGKITSKNLPVRKDHKVKTHMQGQEILQKLFAAREMGRKINYQDIFKHELTSYPMALALNDDILITPSNKSALGAILESYGPTATSNFPHTNNSAMCYIYDGMSLVQSLGSHFCPTLKKSFEEIFKLINYPQDDIRKASVEALLQFCIALHKVNTPEVKQALYKALQMFVPKCAELIRIDEERSIVMVCLDAYSNLLDEIKGDVFVGEGHREAIMNCVIDVLTLKTMCQDTDLGLSTTENNEEDTEAEQDELLLESAGDVIPKYAAAITPDDFSLYFPNILQLMSTRTKKQNSIAQRSFAFGTLAECMKSLDVYVEKFVPTLLNLWLTGAKDSSDEVRNNAVFGLGEMILHGKDRIFSKYPEILQALSAAVAKESHAGTLDNICGALAKMIIVFPAFLQKLPLRDDFQENDSVIKCFFTLYQQGNPILRQHLSNVIKVAVHIYHKDQAPNEDVKKVLIEFLKTINQDFAEDFANTVSSLGPEATESVQKIFLPNKCV